MKRGRDGGEGEEGGGQYPGYEERQRQSEKKEEDEIPNFIFSLETSESLRRRRRGSSIRRILDVPLANLRSPLPPTPRSSRVGSPFFVFLGCPSEVEEEEEEEERGTSFSPPSPDPDPDRPKDRWL